MIALLQRVSEARVVVESETVGAIGPGLAVLIGVQQGDNDADAHWLADKLLAYRVFEDPAGKMNLSLKETGGSLLLIPQFTLAADTRKGNRPSFSRAATPEQGEHLFNTLVDIARAKGIHIETGVFGANMAVSLTNQGPVTFWLESPCAT
ncbi:MAG: D-aminoacyl-tRNA deacylase [Gammaproteobacteria bacterium]|nr:D-aminoacyl-tRNA deacylase [Gammaproteobacteria bacterium]